MRNFRLNFANIFAKTNVGKKFKNDAKFWKKATFFRENAKCKFCFFLRNFRIFCGTYWSEISQKNFIYSRNRSQRIFVFLASERNTKICENVHENFLLRNYRKPIFSFLLPVPSKRVRGFFPFCSQSHQNEWEMGISDTCLIFFPKKRNIFSSKYKIIKNHYDYSEFFCLNAKLTLKNLIIFIDRF